MPRPEKPLNPDDGPLPRFACDLRLLRAAAGKDLARLSRETGYSKPTLSQATGGVKLPTLAVTRAFVSACGGEVPVWEDRWRTLRAELDAQAPARPDELAPYRGLAAFRPEDAGLFFGRERLVHALRELVDQRRFVAVVGASGSGKTSLVAAGLLAGLRRCGSRRHTALVLTPGAQPAAQLVTTLAAHRDVPPATVSAELFQRDGDLGALLHDLLPEDAAEERLLLVVDQFEELYTLGGNPVEREVFISRLATVAAHPDPRLRVVVVVRADFYAHCLQHAALAEALQQAQIVVGPMTTEELRAAIVGPLPGQDRIEGPLLAQLIADATGQAGVLPMFSHALLETWRRRRGIRLCLADYEDIGGIHGAIAKTAEDVYAELTAEGQDLARQLFLRLTALGEGTEDTRRRIARGELDITNPVLPGLLDRLAQARLITLDQNTVEIAHEALIRSWPRLRGWLADDRDGLRIHRQLTEATSAWLRHARDASVLYRGTRLALAQDWAARNPAGTSRLEQEFLQASLAAEKQELDIARGHARRLRQLVALLTVLLLISVLATVQALRTERAATTARNIAISQRVGDQTRFLRPSDPALAARLSLAGYRLAPTTEARSSLFGALATPTATAPAEHAGRVRAVAFSPDGRFLATAGQDGTVRRWQVTDPRRPAELMSLTGHTDVVMTVAFQPSGRLLATGSADRTVRLWDVTTPERPTPLTTLTGHGDKIFNLAFSPDGNLLATSGLDKTVRLWDLRDPRRPQALGVITRHTENVMSVAFHPGGRLLATAAADRSVRLWQVTDPRRPTETGRALEHRADVFGLSFHPDGRTLATASADGVARLWDVTDPVRGVQIAEVTAHQDVAYAIAFDPKGGLLVSAGFDGAVQLLEVTGQRQLRKLPGPPRHENLVLGVAFTPDGRMLATAGADHAARLWDLADPAHPREITAENRHTAGARSVAFSSTGRMLVSASLDRTARLWEVSDPARPRELSRLTGHTGPLTQAVFRPDDTVLATVGMDRTARLWQVRDPAAPSELATLLGHTDTVMSVAFSPDGRTLATASLDRTIRLWDVSDPRRPVEREVLTGHTRGVLSVDFHRDGQVLASGGVDGVIRLWDIGRPGEPRQRAVLDRDSDTVNAVRFSPDGRLLATASAEGLARLWDLNDLDHPSELATLRDPAGVSYSVAFSPDSRKVATGNLSGSIRLWDVTNPRRAVELAVLTRHAREVYGVAFAPDNRTLATAGHDRTVLLWTVDPDEAANRVCAQVHPGISPEEWQRSFPDIELRQPCP